MDAAVALQRKKTIKFLCIVDFLLSKQGIFFITLTHMKDPTQCELFVETVYCVVFLYPQSLDVMGFADFSVLPGSETWKSETAKMHK